jgi:hypothetical protein
VSREAWSAFLLRARPIRAFRPATTDLAENRIAPRAGALRVATGDPAHQPVARADDRDRAGNVRVMTATVSYRRLVERSYEKIRQASVGMPAVMIRQLDALAEVAVYTSTEQQRAVVEREGAKILRLCEESVGEAADRAAVMARYERLLSRIRNGDDRNRHTAVTPTEQ